MKKLLLSALTLLIGVVLCVPMHAQSFPPVNAQGDAYQVLNSATCTASGCQPVNQNLIQGFSTSTGIGWYVLSWTIQGTVSGCTASIDSRDSNTGSWSTGGIISAGSILCTTQGSFATSAANYVNFARLGNNAGAGGATITGSGSVNFTLTGYFNNPAIASGSPSIGAITGGVKGETLVGKSASALSNSQRSLDITPYIAAAAGDGALALNAVITDACSTGINIIHAEALNGTNVAWVTNMFHGINGTTCSPVILLHPGTTYVTSVPQMFPTKGFVLDGYLPAITSNSNGVDIDLCGPASATWNGSNGCTVAGAPTSSCGANCVPQFPDTGNAQTKTIPFNYAHGFFPAGTMACGLCVGGQGTAGEGSGFTLDTGGFLLRGVSVSNGGNNNIISYYCVQCNERSVFQFLRYNNFGSTNNAGLMLDRTEAPTNAPSLGWARAVIEEVNAAGLTTASCASCVGIYEQGSDITITLLNSTGTASSCATPPQAVATKTTSGGLTGYKITNNGGGTCDNGGNNPVCKILAAPATVAGWATFPANYPGTESATGGGPLTCTIGYTNHVITSLTISSTNVGLKTSFLTGAARIRSIDNAFGAGFAGSYGILVEGVLNPSVDGFHGINTNITGVGIGLYYTVNGGTFRQIDDSSAGGVVLGAAADGSQCFDDVYGFNSAVFTDSLANQTILGGAGGAGNTALPANVLSHYCSTAGIFTSGPVNAREYDIFNTQTSYLNCPQPNNAICSSSVDGNQNPNFITTSSTNFLINGGTTPLVYYIAGKYQAITTNITIPNCGSQPCWTTPPVAEQELFIIALLDKVNWSSVPLSYFNGSGTQVNNFLITSCPPLTGYTPPSGTQICNGFTVSATNPSVWFDLSTNTMKTCPSTCSTPANYVANPGILLGVVAVSNGPTADATLAMPFNMNPTYVYENFGDGSAGPNSIISGTTTADGEFKLQSLFMTHSTLQHTAAASNVNTPGLLLYSQTPVILAVAGGASTINANGLGLAGVAGTAGTCANANGGLAFGFGGGGAGSGGANITNAGCKGTPRYTWGFNANSGGGVAGTIGGNGGNGGTTNTGWAGTGTDPAPSVLEFWGNGFGGAGAAGAGVAAGGTGGNGGNGGGVAVIKAPSLNVVSGSTINANGTVGTIGTTSTTSGGCGGGGGGGTAGYIAGFSVNGTTGITASGAAAVATCSGLSPASGNGGSGGNGHVVAIRLH